MTTEQIHEWFTSRGWCWSVGYGGGTNEITARCWKPAFPQQKECFIESGKTVDDAVSKLIDRLHRAGRE